jgi:hypothetical protein
MTVTPWPSLVQSAGPNRYLNRKDDLGVGVQFQAAQLDLGPKEVLAILNHPLKVVSVRFGDVWHPHSYELRG